MVRDAPRVRSVIGLAGQFAAVDENLAGRENLELVGRLYHLGPAEARRRAGEALERFDLLGPGERLVRTYSGGMRRRLDIAASVVGRPQVLFMDEPSAGLDLRSRLQLWEMIARLVREGTTLLRTTQYLEEADKVADPSPSSRAAGSSPSGPGGAQGEDPQRTPAARGGPLAAFRGAGRGRLPGVRRSGGGRPRGVDLHAGTNGPIGVSAGY